MKGGRGRDEEKLRGKVEYKYGSTNGSAKEPDREHRAVTTLPYFIAFKRHGNVKPPCNANVAADEHENSRARVEISSMARTVTLIGVDFGQRK